MHETQTEEHQIHIEVETKSLQLTDTRSVQIKSKSDLRVAAVFHR